MERNSTGKKKEESPIDFLRKKEQILKLNSLIKMSGLCVMFVEQIYLTEDIIAAAAGILYLWHQIYSRF